MAKHILTGGPGCGKTTLCDKLEERGFSIIPEAARQVIAEHGRDIDDLGRKIYDRILHNEEKGGDFCDRSQADSLAYEEFFGGQPFDGWEQRIKDADYGIAFILDTLPEEFYKNDSERTESYEVAVSLHNQLLNTYRKLGFEVVQIPATTPDDRVQRVLSELSRADKMEHELKFAHSEVDLSQYAFDNPITRTEKNYIQMHTGEGNLYDRLRECTNLDGEKTFFYTLKKSGSISRIENEKQISGEIFNDMAKRLRLDITYNKTRTHYTPLGDSNTTICFDEVHGLGKFIEIESATPRNVKIWANRLGLHNPIEKCYAQLVLGRKFH